MAKQMPIKKFRAGLISVAIWKNNGTSKKTGEPVEFNTVSLDRRYKDKDGEYKSTGTLRVSDLPRAVVVLQKAFEFLVVKEQVPSASEATAQEEEIVM